MPTGYTACIGEGATFREFALRAARGMGACVMQRDDDGNALPDPHERPTSYHADRVAEAKARRAAAEAMTPEEAAASADAEYQAAVTRRKNVIAEKSALRSKYEAIREQIEAWQPPTPDHQGFKDFMLQQVDDSIRHDCWSAEDIVTYYPVPPKPSPADHVIDMIQRSQREIDYHEREQAKEAERVAERNAWKRALLDSLA